MTNIASGRKMTIWAIVVLMLVVACINGVAAPGDAKLGEQARRAIGQWPAAQQADQGWEWVRILVFLVQIALGEQGFDPGKPDGLMGPNTMTALLSWRGEKGAPIADGLEPSWDIADIVAQLLHVTLEGMGLSPGPRDQILGRESTAALERWDDTFTWGAISMDIGAHEVARKTVMEGFGQAPPSNAEMPALTQNRASSGSDEFAAAPKTNNDLDHKCVKVAWTGDSPNCSVYLGIPGKCIWVIDVHNACGYPVIVHFLRDRKDGRGPRWITGVAGASGFVFEARSYGPSGFGDWTRTEMPEHSAPPGIQYCVHKWDPRVRAPYIEYFRDPQVKDRFRRWYRNDFRDGRDSTEVDRNTSGDYAPNTRCLATY